MRSDWWIGDKKDWDALLEKPPKKCPGGEPDEPMKAFALMCLNGARVEGVVLREDGTLTLLTSNNEEIILTGREEVFEESWIIDVPVSVPNHEYWSVVCSDIGELLGRCPESALDAQ